MKSKRRQIMDHKEIKMFFLTATRTFILNFVKSNELKIQTFFNGFVRNMESKMYGE